VLTTIDSAILESAVVMGIAARAVEIWISMGIAEVVGFLEKNDLIGRRVRR